MQALSEKYWRRSSDTYLGSSTYYDQKADALVDVLAALPQFEHGLDLGCGDGRYTLLLARHCAQVEGADIGPLLIEAGQKNATAVGVTNVTYRVSAAAETLGTNRDDLPAALGVTLCIVDDDAFAAFLGSLAAAARPGATLLLIDSLARRKDMLSKFDSGYVTRYRPVDAYLYAVQFAGFDLVEGRDLGTPASSRILRTLPIGRKMNRLYWLSRA